MTSRPITTGILSYGMSGKVFHCPFLASNPHFKLHAVTERSTKKVEEIYPNVRSYDSTDELINDPEVELVIVNTPNYTHYQYAKQALKAGKHVLVEKPFCTTYEEAADLFETGRRTSRKVLVYQNRRWDSDFLSLQSIISSNVLGDIIELSIRFDRYKPEIGRKAFKETPQAGSGITFDLGPHILDQAISLFGQPLHYSLIKNRYREHSLVDDYLHIHLVYKGGTNIYLTTGLLIATPLPAFVIHGTKGTYIKKRSDVQEEQLLEGILPIDTRYGLESEEDKGILTLYTEAGKREIKKIEGLKGDYNQLFNHVYHSIRESKPFPVKEEEVLLQLKILSEQELGSS